MLLVDDERALTNLVRMALQYEGWEIDVAHDAAEAVDKYRASTPHTVELPGLGWYRMVSRPGDGDEILVTGVSRTPAWNAMVRETVTVSAMTALALLVTALSTVAIVRYALRPLRRVSSTAAEVATLPLDRDNYAITPRVSTGDTDPRTEVGLVGDTLNRLLDHVERALADVAASDRRMRQFITDASHELRTPLAAIHGYAELTRQDSSVLPETTEYSLARIEAEAHRMSSLVADLLQLARLDEGHDLENADVDLTELVADAVNDVRVSAPTHQWRIKVPDGAVWVRGDRARLHQMLAVLLSNARLHTPETTTVTTIVATGRADDGKASTEVAVSDDRPGIDSELLPHVFGPVDRRLDRGGACWDDTGPIRLRENYFQRPDTGCRGGGSARHIDIDRIRDDQRLDVAASNVSRLVGNPGTDRCDRAPRQRRGAGPIDDHGVTTFLERPYGLVDIGRTGRCGRGSADDGERRNRQSTSGNADQDDVLHGRTSKVVVLLVYSMYHRDRPPPNAHTEHTKFESSMSEMTSVCDSSTMK